MCLNGDSVRADLVAVDDEPCRGKIERHDAMTHAIRPSLAEAPILLESLGMHPGLHQLRDRAKTSRLIAIEET